MDKRAKLYKSIGFVDKNVGYSFDTNLACYIITDRLRRYWTITQSYQPLEIAAETFLVPESGVRPLLPEVLDGILLDDLELLIDSWLLLTLPLESVKRNVKYEMELKMN